MSVQKAREHIEGLRDRLLPPELVPYREHLRSPRWRQIRRAALKRDGYRCTNCGRRKGRLEVHHITYERLGHERLADLRTLCEDCHGEVHWWLRNAGAM